MASDKLSLDDDVQKRLRQAQQKVGCDHGNDRRAARGVGQNKHSFLTVTALGLFCLTQALLVLKQN